MSAWASSSYGLNPSLAVNQYGHKAWRVRDGFAGGEIAAIAQTADGYLWLGSSQGLFRFDGITAVRWDSLGQAPLPSDNIWSLLGARDGALWIGTDRGLVKWNGRTLTSYDQLAGQIIGQLLEDREGVIWVARALGDASGWASPCHVDRGRLACNDRDTPAVSLFEDSHGRLWAASDHGVERLKPGPPTFYKQSRDELGAGGMSEDDDGTLLFSRSSGIFRFIDGRSSIRLPRLAPSAPAHSLLRDRDGGLWIGTAAFGLVHVHRGVADAYTEADGLSADPVRSVFEDHEGNIWVATSDGIDRFRDAVGAAVTVKQGLASPLVQALAAAADGSVWATASGALHRLRNDVVTTYRVRTNLRTSHPAAVDGRQVREIRADWTERLTALFQDRRGRIWVGSRGGVGYLENDRLVRIDDMPEGSPRAIVEDSETLWVVDDHRGLSRVRPDGRDVAHVPQTTLNRQEMIMAAAADPNRPGVWLGFTKGGLVFFDDGRVKASYDTSQGLGAGIIWQLLFDRDGALWAATEGGLSRVQDGRVTTLTVRNGLPCDRILTLVQDEARALWMTTACGTVRISREDIDRWVEKGGTVRPTTFDATDGLRTYVNLFPYSAPAVKSTDGRLWFLSLDGLAVVDPRRLAINTRPPPVRIERVTANQQRHDVPPGGGRIALPALIRDLQIDYTALSLVASEKNQFRYKLEGYDRDWQDAGNRRQAFYTNLRPRSYRFRVIASNNSGVWNETGASVDLTIPPAYYQTNWFIAFITGLVIALIWTAHRVRLRMVERHEGEISALNERLMKAQEQERIRIAGELHDGVMQQMLSVTMLLGAAKRKIAGNAEVQASIDKIQDKLVQAGTDIRQLSHGLHPPQLQDAGLPGALRTYCEEFSAASGIAVACELDEHARDLSRGASLALFRIVQEALGNAARHAAAKHVVVSLKRADSTVALTVSDDGVGFDRARLGTSGGLGLVMMRERAGQLNGSFEFESVPGRGTTIRVEVPFR
jgi:signal transduction histidine kinase/ligand-binding sensor domain-containing protein